jgi:hypothetical protein
MKRDGLKVTVDIEMHCNRYGVMVLLLFLSSYLGRKESAGNDFQIIKCSNLM